MRISEGEKMSLNTKTVDYRMQNVINIPSIGMCLVVALSFLLHLFTKVFSGYAYAAMLAVFTIICISSKKVLLKGRRKNIRVWFLSTVVVTVSFLYSQRSNGALLDVIVFSCGLLLVFFCSNKESVYYHSISVIKKLAILFAVGVVLQFFLPSLYRIILYLFPKTYRSALLSNEGSGFTLNPGYSAGYIIVGLIAVFSEYNYVQQIRIRNIGLPLFLFFALILTGKRGPTLFLILTFIYAYLVPVKGAKKVKRYWRIFLILFFTVIIIWAFRDALSQIPFIGRILNTIAGAIDGEDVTSGRTRLYLWALKLFKENPIFGIGWGRFRTTVVGHVTLVYELEVHNIYLQLLAETGLIGFLVFVTMFVIFWNEARIAYCNTVNIQQKSVRKTIWTKLLFFSLAYQTYFLLYGLSGNPLYDPHFQIMYIFSCLIITAHSGIKYNKNLSI